VDRVDVSLPRNVVERAKEITGRRSPREALTALVREHGVPNAATARSLRAKPSARDKTFASAKSATAYLRKRFG
jgi:hypothetical protein